MAVPTTAFKFPDPMDSSEILNWKIPLTSVLEVGEEIDANPGRWSLELLPDAMAFGFEIIKDDAEYPDPQLVDGNTAIVFWAKVDEAFYGDPVFQGGVSAPMVATAWTNSIPPRRRQRTALLTIVEQ